MSRTGIADVIGWALYVVICGIGACGVYFSLFFAMATDACPDAACEASHHVWPAMLTMWVGVGAVLLATPVAMVLAAQRGRLIVGVPLAGLLGLSVVFVVAGYLVS